MAVTRSGEITRRRNARLLGAGVFVLSVAIYLPVLGHSWLNYDDNVYITESAPVLAGWNRDSLTWAFTSFDGANWFPLTRLSWLLDSELHGTRAAGFLATNVALHALASLAFFAAFTRLTGNAARSAFVAAAFAVHPLHVESVAWIAARKDGLSGLFFALAILAYARSVTRGCGFVDRLVVFGLMACGAMAKPTVVSLPFVLVLCDFWPLRRLTESAASSRPSWSRVRSALSEKWELFALAAGFSVVTLLAQDSGGAVASLEQLAPADRLANALHSYAAYLGKAVWPSKLAVFYPHSGEGLGATRVTLAAALLFGVSLLAWLQRSARPYLAFGWCWYLGTLVPVIGIVQVGSQAMADRYTYLPLVGLAVSVTWGVADACSRSSRRRLLAPALAVSVLFAWSLTTSIQLRHWRDSEALFRHALDVTEANHVAHSYLGAALQEQGRTAEAIAEYKRALLLRSNLLTVSNNLGWLLATHPDARFRDSATAVAVSENAADLTGRTNPSVLDTLAAAYASAGRFDAAVAVAGEAAAIAERGGNRALAAEISGRRELYRARRPYREGSD